MHSSGAPLSEGCRPRETNVAKPPIAVLDDAPRLTVGARRADSYACDSPLPPLRAHPCSLAALEPTDVLSSTYLLAVRTACPSDLLSTHVVRPSVSHKEIARHG
jgi:hypothetical protein